MSATPVQAVWICASPVKYLIICCPKPCPTVDYAKVALHAGKVIVDKARIALTADHTETVRNTETSLGLEGKRATTLSVGCPINDKEMVLSTLLTRKEENPDFRGHAISLANASLEESDDDEGLREHGADIGLHRLKQRTVADATLAGETLARWADTAAEGIAKASDAVPRAGDAREMTRRISEMRIEINRLDQITQIARATRVGVEGSTNLTSRTRKQ